jgi:hypothetical protein
VGWQSSTESLSQIWLQVREDIQRKKGFLLCVGDILEPGTCYLNMAISVFFSSKYGHFVSTRPKTGWTLKPTKPLNWKQTVSNLMKGRITSEEVKNLI